MSRESLLHLVDGEHLDQHRERWAAHIEAALTDPLEVWLAPVEDRAGRGFMGVAQENKDGSLLWTALNLGRVGRAAYLDQNRAGGLLHRRRGGG